MLFYIDIFGNGIVLNLILIFVNVNNFGSINEFTSIMKILIEVVRKPFHAVFELLP